MLKAGLNLILFSLFSLSFVSKADILVDFPKTETRTFDGSTITFNLLGQAKREFLFFDVYDIGNYASADWNGSDLPYPPVSLELLSSNTQKMLVLQYHRDLKVEKAKEVLRDGFRNNTTGQEWNELEPELKRFLEKMDKDIKAGDSLELIWTEGKVFRVSFQKRDFAISTSELFLRTLWSIWLGENSVVKREDLFAR